MSDINYNNGVSNNSEEQTPRKVHKRTDLTLKQKVDVGEAAKNGMKTKEITLRWGIRKNTACTLKKNLEANKLLLNSLGANFQSRRQRHGKEPEIELFIVNYIRKNMPDHLDRDRIRSVACQYALEHGKPDFVAPDGWLRRTFKRWNINGQFQKDLAEDSTSKRSESDCSLNNDSILADKTEAMDEYNDPSSNCILYKDCPSISSSETPRYSSHSEIVGTQSVEQTTSFNSCNLNEETFAEVAAAAKIIETGFHPDFVFSEKFNQLSKYHIQQDSQDLNTLKEKVVGSTKALEQCLHLNLMQKLAEAPCMSIILETFSTSKLGGTGISQSVLLIMAAWQQFSDDSTQCLPIGLVCIDKPTPLNGDLVKYHLENTISKLMINMNKIVAVISGNNDDVGIIKAVHRHRQFHEKQWDFDGSCNDEEIDDLPLQLHFPGDTDSPGRKLLVQRSKIESQQFYCSRINNLTWNGYFCQPVTCLPYIIPVIVSQVVDSNLEVISLLHEVHVFLGQFRESRITVELLRNTGHYLCAAELSRWSGAYWTLQSLLEMRNSLELILSDSDVMLSSDLWTQIRQYIDFLRPFAFFAHLDNKNTDDHENYSMANLLPAFIELEAHLDKMSEISWLSHLVGLMRGILTTKLSKWLDPNHSHFNPLPATACFLEPRWKSIFQLDKFTPLLTAVRNFLSALDKTFTSHSEDKMASPTETDEDIKPVLQESLRPSPSTPTCSSQTYVPYQFLSPLLKEPCVSLDDEVSFYLTMPTRPDFTRHQFWTNSCQEKSQYLPCLSRLARSLGCLSVSSPVQKCLERVKNHYQHLCNGGKQTIGPFEKVSILLRANEDLVQQLISF